MSIVEHPKADRPVTLSEVVSAEYESLHQIAACCFLHERTDHTLQATAVLHEAFLSVSDSVMDTPGPRIYYLAAMARGIRQVLVRHARSRNAIKRNGGRQRLDQPDLIADTRTAIDLCALDDAIKSLEKIHARSAKIVDLRYFGKLNNQQIGALLGISSRTVQIDWQFARAWLSKELRDCDA